MKNKMINSDEINQAEFEKAINLLLQKDPDLIIVTPKGLKKIIDKNIQEYLHHTKHHTPPLASTE